MCTIQATSKIVHAEIIQTFATAKQRANNCKTNTPPMTHMQSNTTSTHGHDNTEDERFAKQIYKIYRPQDAKVIWSTPRYETSHMPNQPFADPRFNNRVSRLGAFRHPCEIPDECLYGSGRTYSKGYNYHPESAVICVLIFKNT